MKLPFFRRTAQVVSISKDSDQATAINLGAATIAAAGASVVDLDTSGYSILRLFGQIGNGTTPATAAGDIIIGVQPYMADGVSLGGNWMNQLVTDFVAVLNSNVAYLGAKYDVSGFSKVRLIIGNNNAGALQGAKLDYFLQA